MHFMGIITPLVTPLDKRGDIDEDSLARLIDWQIAKGVHGIFVLGTNGEGNLLLDEQKRRVVRVASESVAGRVPLLCGVSDTSLPRVLANIESIAQYEFDAYVSTLPYYCITGPEEQYGFFRSLCEAVDRPLMAYNIPSFVKNDIAVEVIERLLEFDRFAGVKESGDDLGRYRRLMAAKARKPEISFFTGCSHLVDVAYSLGFDGGVIGLANIIPAQCGAWHSMYMRGDVECARAVQAGTLRILEKVMAYRKLKGHATTLPGTKSILRAMGIIRESTLVAPYLGEDAADESELRAICEAIRAEEADLTQHSAVSYQSVSGRLDEQPELG